MKALLIGNSPHLHHAIACAFPDAALTVIPWRAAPTSAFTPAELNGTFDLIFVLGFHYGSYLMKWSDFVKANLETPLAVIEPFASNSIPVIYVNTAAGKKRSTWSRYRYAKEALGSALKARYPQCKIVRFRTFADENREPLVHGPWLQKRLFRFLIAVGIVGISTPSEIVTAFKQFDNADAAPVDLQPIALAFSRPQWLDRLMRLILG
jgi:hypothetical protein